MLDVKDLAEQDTSLKKASSREYAGPCPSPECGKKTDGFRVRCDEHGHWAFMCRGCWDARETLPDGIENVVGEMQLPISHITDILA